MKRTLVLFIMSLFMLVSCDGEQQSSSKVQNLQIGSLQVSPSADVVIAGDIPIGLTVPFKATAFYTNNNKVPEDYTNKVKWQNESGANVAPIDPNTGVLEALSQGTFKVTASDELSHVSASIAAKVIDSKLKAIYINEPKISTGNNKLPVDIEEQLNAIGIFDSNSSFDVSNSITWNSEEPSIVSVDNINSKGLIKALKPDQEATIDATWNHNGVIESAKIVVHTSSAHLVRLELKPKTLIINHSIPVGVTIPYKVTGYFDDGHIYDLTKQAKWQPNLDKDQHVAINPNGEITALSRGGVELEASVNDKVATTNLAINGDHLTRIHIEPANNGSQHALLTGGVTLFKAIGVYEPSGANHDMTDKVTWISESNSVINVIAGNPGLVRGVTNSNNMPVNISASIHVKGDLIGSNKYPLTVVGRTLDSAEISPNNKVLYLYIPQQYLALGYASNYQLDLNNMAVWTTIPSGLGSFGSTYNQKGLFVPKRVTTNAAIKAVLARFGQSPEAIFSIVDKGIIGSLTTNGAPESMAKFVPIRLTAQATFDDGTTIDITNSRLTSWSSSKPGVIQYSGTNGEFISESEGTAILNITFNNPYSNSAESASVSIRVNNSTITGLSISPNPSTMVVGGKKQFKALLIDSENNTYSADQFGIVNWKSNSSNLDIDPVTGVATAKEIPESGIKVTAQLSNGTNPGLTANATVNIVNAHLDGIIISPNKASLEVGNSITYSAEAVYSNPILREALISPNQVKWSVDESQYASIDPDGKLNALTTGLLNVTAQLITQGKLDNRPEAISSIPLQIVESSTDTFESLEIISNDNTPLAIGQKRAYTVIAHYANHDDGSINLNNLSWSSVQESVATINSVHGSDEFGVATAKGNGSTTIKAVLYPYVTKPATIQLSVDSGLTLESIEISGPHQGALNDQLSYKAYGYYRNANGDLVNSHVDITKQVSWTILPSEAGSFGMDNNNHNVLTILKTGEANIGATLAGVNSTPYRLNVDSATRIESIIITSVGSDTIQIGAIKQYKLIEIYNNIHDNDVTDATVWVPESSGIIALDNINQKGTLTALSTGYTNVLAYYANKLAKRSVKVVAADVTNQLESVWLRDSVTKHDYKLSESFTLAYRHMHQFSLIASYKDGTTQPIEPKYVAWQSSQPTKVSFDGGNAIALESNVVVDIWGSYTTNGKTRKTPLVHINVPKDELSKLIINTHPESVASGGSVSFSATGYFGTTDNTGTNPLTSGVTWSSSDTSKVSFADSIKGIAQIANDATGPVTITVSSVDNPAIESSTVIQIITGAPAMLESLEIIPANHVFMESGETRQYILMAHYADTGLDQPIDNSEINWSSDFESIISINDNGIATAVSPGRVTITARYRNNSPTTTQATFNPEVITGISLMPISGVHIYHLGLSIKADVLIATKNHGKSYVSSSADASWQVIPSTMATVTKGNTDADPVTITAKEADTGVLEVSYHGYTESVPLTISEDTVSQIILLPAKSFVIGTKMRIPKYYQVMGYFKNTDGEMHHEVIDSKAPGLSLISTNSAYVNVDKDGTIVGGETQGKAIIKATYINESSSVSVAVNPDVKLESTALTLFPKIESTVTNGMICYVVFARIGNQVIDVSKSVTLDAGNAGSFIKGPSCMDTGGVKATTMLPGILVKTSNIANLSSPVTVSYAGTSVVAGKLSTNPIDLITSVTVEGADFEAMSGGMHPGTHQQVVAYSDNLQSISRLVTWSVDLPAKIDQNGLLYIPKTVSEDTDVTVTATYNGMSNSYDQPIQTGPMSNDPDLPALQIIVQNPQSDIGDAMPLIVDNRAYVQVITNYDDGSSQDVTNYATIITDNPQALPYNQLDHSVIALESVSNPESSIAMHAWFNGMNTKSIRSAESGLFIKPEGPRQSLYIYAPKSTVYTLIGGYAPGFTSDLTYDAVWSMTCDNGDLCDQIQMIPIGPNAGEIMNLQNFPLGAGLYGYVTIRAMGYNPDDRQESIEINERM